MLSNTLIRAGSAEVLTGRLAEHQEMLDVFAEHPGLMVVSADPWSGTSALLASVASELASNALVVDARTCHDGLDLAMTIADASIATFASDASPWWTNDVPESTAAGLRIARSVSSKGIDLDDLRLGTGSGEQRLSDAVDLLIALSGGEVTLLIDHLGLMLSSLRQQETRKLLGQLRTLRQEHPGLDLVLVQYPAGPVSGALGDREHPLYRAGSVMRIRRPKPRRFAEDLVITRAWTDVSATLLEAAAELAAGVPALAWRTIDLSPSAGRDDHARALSGWRSLRKLTELTTARQWDVLRRVHPVAQSVVAAISVGLRPHAVAANSKSVNTALAQLRRLGMAWQPEPRRWALADPLLEAWVRDHAPSWTIHSQRNSGTL